MTWILTGPFLYAAFAVFLMGTAYKIVSLVRMPRHLRWEIYPLPHVGAAGSRYQQVDYASSPRTASRWAELAFMAREILLLEKLFSRRRDLWFGSYFLHVGLYFSILGVILLAADGVWSVLGPIDSSTLLVRVLREVIIAAGIGGAAAGLIGTASLLIRRLTDLGLRDMSDPATFFNLVLLLLLFGTGLYAWTAENALLQARDHVASLLYGRPGVVASPSLAAAMVVAGLFVAYLPFSRMFHFAAKYFFYHRVLWDDEPMHAHSAMERDFAAYLDYPLTWSGGHLQAQKAWGEQLSSHPPTESRVTDSGEAKDG